MVVREFHTVQLEKTQAPGQNSSTSRKHHQLDNTFENTTQSNIENQIETVGIRSENAERAAWKTGSVVAVYLEMKTPKNRPISSVLRLIRYNFYSEPFSPLSQS